MPDAFLLSSNELCGMRYRAKAIQFHLSHNHYQWHSLPYRKLSNSSTDVVIIDMLRTELHA